MTQRTCTKNNGCFIKRREETDEYGDVTRLDLSNMRPGCKIFRYTIQRGCVNNLVEGTGCYDGKETGVSADLL